MPSSSCLLCALVPPGSVEAEMSRLQDTLFSAYGFASSPAVPPLIPVAFLPPQAPVAGFLLEMNRSVPAGWRMAVQDGVWIEGHLFAGVRSSGAWQALRACAEARGAVVEGPFPAFEGFYLGCGEAEPESRAAVRLELPALSFSSAALVIMRIDSAAPPRWWRELHWEIIEQRQFRGRRAA